MRASARWYGGSLPKREYLCRHCGRRVFAEHGVLTEVQLCRSCFEKAYGGWTFKISRGEEGDKFKLDETRSSKALLLGRVTYEGFAAAWPSREGEFADKFNAMPKYVVSSTLTNPTWSNSTVLKGDVADQVRKLKQKQDGDIVVHGSARLVQTLLENDLVDELRLMVFPVVLGTGKRLFGEMSNLKALRLVDARVVGEGVTILRYEPAPEKAKEVAATASSRSASTR